ncbi:MAG: hypothetical protein Q8K78_17735 [Planctomycetaceae bacterium]|nr:hypothetical protein [Planctomycetaceae bacterium]
MNHRRPLHLFVVALALCSSITAAEPGIVQLGKAAPDEFFVKIGGPYYPLGQQPSGAEGQPKVNQAYVWGMTKAGDSIWFGTAANPVSLVIGGLLGISIPRQNEYMVSEFWRSQYPGISPLLKPFLGDWRPPRIYRYQPNGGVQDVTPTDPLLSNTIGLRSAGASDEIVLLAGPALTQLGINVFAFDAQTGAYIGSKAILEFSDIRKWVEVGGVLYTGTLDTWTQTGGGSVLRWKGNRENPFQYEVVGKIDNEAATLCAHEGRLYAFTWATVSPFWTKLVNAKSLHLPAVWMSPPIPEDGLTAANRFQWKNVWTIDKYDPDPVLAPTLWMGAAESFDGHLVWGTIQIPGTGGFALLEEYGSPETLALFVESYRNSFRTAPLFRGKLTEAQTLQVDVLYGDATLPKYTPAGPGQGAWSFVPNKTGTPLFGPAGFGQPANAYIWSMAVHDDKLYVGTFDRSFIRYGNAFATGQPVPNDLGADLVQFTSVSTAGQAITRTGAGNVINNGIRTLISHPEGLFAGTATSANLLTDPNDNIPEGGWEFLKIDPAAIVLSPLRSAAARAAMTEAETWQHWLQHGTMPP